MNKKQDLQPDHLTRALHPFMKMKHNSVVISGLLVAGCVYYCQLFRHQRPQPATSGSKGKPVVDVGVGRRWNEGANGVDYISTADTDPKRLTGGRWRLPQGKEANYLEQILQTAQIENGTLSGSHVCAYCSLRKTQLQICSLVQLLIHPFNLLLISEDVKSIMRL